MMYCLHQFVQSCIVPVIWHSQPHFLLIPFLQGIVSYHALRFHDVGRKQTFYLFQVFVEPSIEKWSFLRVLTCRNGIRNVRVALLSYSAHHVGCCIYIIPKLVGIDKDVLVEIHMGRTWRLRKERIWLRLPSFLS